MVDRISWHGRKVYQGAILQEFRRWDIRTRIKSSSDISRILYFFFVGDKAVLTNGFVKKTQKTPRKEIEKAKTYRKDYLRRNT